MRFKSLHVHKRYDNSLNGSVTVDGNKGEITLNLTNDELREIMEICCDSLVRISP